MKVLAPGITLFESNTPGPRRLYSAGIHGNEIEGQQVINSVLRKLESKSVVVKNGSVLIVLANLQAIEEGNRCAKDELDFNRLFHTNLNPRINLIKKWVKKFKPTIHLDFHSTIKKVDSPFALCSRSQPGSHDDFTEFARRYNLEKIVQFIFEDTRELTTFAGYTAQNFGAESYTIELGQIGKSFTRKVIPTMIDGVISEISDVSCKKKKCKFELWRMEKKLTKKSHDFRFCRVFENFQRLRKGETVAIDQRNRYLAPKNAYILFPNPAVDIGGRAAVYLYKLRNL